MHRFSSIEELAEFVVENSDKEAMITFHSVGDTDAVSSAIAVSKCFGKSRITTPDIITSNANRILDRTGFEDIKIESTFYEEAGIIVLLDANDFEECGQFKSKIENFPGLVLIIDHHLPGPNYADNVYVFDEESYCATASIIYKLMKEMGKNVEQKEAKVLLAGIISDSAELRNSTPETFMQIGELLEIAKTGYYSMRKLMSHEESAESRSWAIKDLLGANVFIKEGLLFVSGKAHAHANLSADNAIRLGADIAIFYAENESEVSFSARLNIDLDRRYNIHLGKVMRQLAPIIKGNGGGHPAAAGAYGPLKQASQEFLERFFEECIKKVQNERRQAEESA
ncbi:MAG: DHH family phosphoesterase [Candidatus Micrarchaeia archaeon]